MKVRLSSFWQKVNIDFDEGKNTSISKQKAYGRSRNKVYENKCCPEAYL